MAFQIRYPKRVSFVGRRWGKRIGQDNAWPRRFCKAVHRLHFGDAFVMTMARSTYDHHHVSTGPDLKDYRTARAADLSGPLRRPCPHG